MVLLGELYKAGILPEEIIHICIVDMLFKQESEEQLESLCSLMLTAGYVLDTSPSSRLKMDTYFISLKNLATDTTRFTSRLRYRCPFSFFFLL